MAENKIEYYAEMLPESLRDVFRGIVIKIEAGWRRGKRPEGMYHWNYKGGISSKNKTIRNGLEIKDWRKKVFERDCYTCRHCGIRGGTLHAHHIKSFAKFKNLRFDVSNGLTLCRNCHHNVHKKSTHV